MSEKQTHGDRFDDDGDSFLIVDYGKDRLKCRVGPVYDGDTPNPEPGIWIDVEGRDGDRAVTGPVIVISPATFRALAAHIERRLSIRREEAADGAESEDRP